MQIQALNEDGKKIPWSRKGQPTPVFLPGRSHGQNSLEGYGPWGHKESDTTEVTEYTCGYTTYQLSINGRLNPFCFWAIMNNAVIHIYSFTVMTRHNLL